MVRPPVWIGNGRCVIVQWVGASQRKSRILIRTWCLSLAVLVASSSAFAANDSIDRDLAEDFYEAQLEQQSAGLPRLLGTVTVEIEQDWTPRANDPDRETADLYANIDGFLRLLLTPEFNLQSDLIFEPIDDSKQNYRAFEGHGLVVETLAAEYEDEAGSVKIGKFDPIEGIWDRATRFFDSFIDDDFDLSESIAARGQVAVRGAAIGAHSLTGGVFFSDTSVLSNPIFSDESRLDRDDGGLANTERFDNAVITLSAESLPFLPQAGYAVGLARRSAGRTESRDETALFAGLYGLAEPDDDTEIEGFLQVLRLENAGGEDGSTASYLVGGAVTVDNWQFLASHSARFRDDPEQGGSSRTDHDWQASVGYIFEAGFYIYGAYRYGDDADGEVHTLGAFIGYELDFDTVLR